MIHPDTTRVLTGLALLSLLAGLLAGCQQDVSGGSGGPDSPGVQGSRAQTPQEKQMRQDKKGD